MPACQQTPCHHYNNLCLAKKLDLRVPLTALRDEPLPLQRAIPARGRQSLRSTMATAAWQHTPYNLSYKFCLVMERKLSAPPAAFRGESPPLQCAFPFRGPLNLRDWPSLLASRQLAILFTNPA